MNIILIICAIIISLIIFYISRGKETKNVQSIDNKHPKNDDITISLNGTLKKSNNYASKHKALDSKEKRKIRKDNLYLLLHYINLYTISESPANFYELEKSISDYNKCLRELSSIDINEYLFLVAFRIHNLRIKYNYYTESRYINTNDTDKLTSHQPLDVAKLSSIAIVNFEYYWNNVLNNYKRVDAQKKRYIYLINYLAELKSKDYISNNNSIITKISALENRYTQALMSLS